MSRRPFIAGNWKLNLGPAAAAALGAELKVRLAARGDIDVAVFPTALSITAALQATEGAGISVGVQNVYVEATGAFTGENSAAMAREAGCTYALLGHSERRHVFGESDALIGQKVHASLAAGLLPMLCIGETLPEREAGQVEAVIHRQLETGLAGLSEAQVGTVTLAYEPVWAIGTGVTASPEQAQEVHAFIRSWLRERYAPWIADETRVLYGGSVKASNAAELLSQPDIDGALVGGAALSAVSFAGIVAGALA
ncbi:MAG: triose-phosphate isomerase [Deltaproteobacteria bacterium]|nr:triose-phosphate isomerase [Deltaproteobacteria bacterium]